MSFPVSSPAGPAGDAHRDPEAERRTREFDYGLSDDRDEAARRARRAVAAEIRRVAASDSFASPAVQAAYEHAALLAEGSGHESADQRPPRRC